MAEKRRRYVAIEEPLFEMETDKLNIEMTSTASGTLLKILKEEGETVPITEVIAYIGDPDEEIDVIWRRKQHAKKDSDCNKIKKEIKRRESEVTGDGKYILLQERGWQQKKGC